MSLKSLEAVASRLVTVKSTSSHHLQQGDGLCPYTAEEFQVSYKLLIAMLSIMAPANINANPAVKAIFSAVVK